MDFSSYIGQLGLNDFRDVLSPDWELSRECKPSEFPFLKVDFIKKYSDIAGLDGDTVNAVTQLAGELSEDSRLCDLLWHQHYLLFKSKKRGLVKADRFPHLGHLLGDKAYTYNLLLTLSGYPYAVEFYRKKGIPGKIMEDTLEDLACWCRYNRNEKNVFGILPDRVAWFINHTHGKLFKLGRLQFMRSVFRGRIVAFRNRYSGRVQALSLDNIRFNSKGLVDGVDGNFDREGSWVAKLFVDSEKIHGNPVSPLGTAVREPVSLDLKEWKQVLAPKYPMLDIHIQDGGNMTTEACADSIIQANAFFREYFPKWKYNGFMCYSWFLDNQYESILGEKSNIVQFQRACYLFPVSISGKDAVWRIFGRDLSLKDMNEFPAKSSMQKKVLAFLRSGGKLRAGGAFLLNDDLPWGEQVYRKNYISQHTMCV